VTKANTLKEEMFMEKVWQGKFMLEPKEGKIWKMMDNQEIIEPQLLNTTITKKGYYYSNFRYAGVSYAFFVHRMLYAYVHGPTSSDLQINHKYGNKLNNRIDNLELGTAKENMRHAFKIGLIKKRSNYPPSDNLGKLTRDEVRAIKILHELGFSNRKQLSGIFKVARWQIGRIVKGISWKHIKI